MACGPGWRMRVRPGADAREVRGGAWWCDQGGGARGPVSLGLYSVNHVLIRLGAPVLDRVCAS
jgi:hypothetical protein